MPNWIKSFIASVSFHGKKAFKSSSFTESKEKFVFTNYPTTYDEFVSLEEAKMSTPFETVALTVLAFTYYPNNKECQSTKMVVEAAEFFHQENLLLFLFFCIIKL